MNILILQVYPDLMAKYENPIEHTCDVTEGQQWLSVDGNQPEGEHTSAKTAGSTIYLATYRW